MISATISAPAGRSQGAVAVPLSAPNADAAWEFLAWLIPSTVFSAGSGRLRRRGPRLQDGQRSDQGFLVFSRADRGRVRQIALKSPATIRSYLADQVAGELADHWVAVQSTQYRSRRDGRGAGGFTAETTRHLLGITIDLDGHRMDPAYGELLNRDWYAFREIVDEVLAGVGVERYRLVRTSPGGVHVHIPLMTPAGRPYRAGEQTVRQWQMVCEGLCRLLRGLGADANAAARLTQPFVLPGLARAKHSGYVPYVAGGQDGDYSTLPELLRALAARKLLTGRKLFPVGPSPSPSRDAIAEALADIAERAVGVPAGGRNDTSFRVATYLLSRGASEAQTWMAMSAWNRKNDPPMPERELRGRLASALRSKERNPVRWARGAAAPWRRLRAELGLPLPQSGYSRNGRWRPLTPRRSWEDRKRSGGREHYTEVEERLLRWVAGEGGQVSVTQAQICNAIDTHRSTLKAVVRRLEASGALSVTTKRGRGGLTTLTAVPLAQNGPSRINTVGAQPGVWVGGAGAPGDASGLPPGKENVKEGTNRGDRLSTDLVVESVEPEMQADSGDVGVAERGVAPAAGRARGAGVDVVAAALSLMGEKFLLGSPRRDWLVVWQGRGRCVLTSRAPQDTLLVLFRQLGYDRELSERLGVQVDVQVRQWKPDYRFRDWVESRFDDPRPDED